MFAHNLTDKEFYAEEISEEIFNIIKGKSYKEYCTVPLGELRYIHVLHRNLDGNVCEGELIVNTIIAEKTLHIFRKLYEEGYPIEKIKLIDYYDANDELSMRDNNSSAFNFRYISHTSIYSKHAFGLAIDINPLYNPYIKMVDGKLSVEPETAYQYIDRDKEFPYKINENDFAYNLFIQEGFEWGGHWTEEKDYQHFEYFEK